MANCVGTTTTITTPNVAQFVTATFAGQTTWAGSKTYGAGTYFQIFLMNASGINIAATNGNTFEFTGLILIALRCQLPHVRRSSCGHMIKSWRCASDIFITACLKRKVL